MLHLKLRKDADWCEGYLRGERMYEFLDRLITHSRVRDFSGIKATGFDGRGNYNLGVIEQIIFQKLTLIK
jgi:large subunit ribosomal protein L5